MKTMQFVNEGYKKEWLELVPNMYDRDGNHPRYCEGTAISEDGGIDWAVFDGGQNYMGRVNKATGEIIYDNGNDEYNDTFLKAAAAAICGK